MAQGTALQEVDLGHNNLAEVSPDILAPGVNMIQVSHGLMDQTVKIVKSLNNYIQNNPGCQALRHWPNPAADRADHQAKGGDEAQDPGHLLQRRHQRGAQIPAAVGRAENSRVFIPHALKQFECACSNLSSKMTKHFLN